MIDEPVPRCGGSGMILYNPGPNQAGEMCPGCEDCEDPTEEVIQKERYKALKADEIREDGRFERHCEHGIGHTVGHLKDTMLEWDWVHGCDGCCASWPRQGDRNERDKG